MCKNTNDRLFEAARTTTYTDTAALDALRTALARQGCSVFLELEGTLRHQLVTMAREATNFNNLVDRLNEAGVKFLTTRFAAVEQDREREIQSARNTLLRAYREDIQDIANGIRDEVRSGFIEDLEALDTHLYETIGGCERVIYTSLAQEACCFSDNEDAWEEVSADGGDWSARAFWAVRQDVADELGDLLHDEDAFDLLRAESGFQVTWEDACEVSLRAIRMSDFRPQLQQIPE